MDRILLKNANLFDSQSGGLRRGVDILIEKDRVKEVGQIETAPGAEMRTIDCSGKYVLPGLFDCHTHLSALTKQGEEAQRDIFQECQSGESFVADDLETSVLADFVAKGITQVRDQGGPLNTLKALKSDIDNGRRIGPDIYYAGPMLEKSPLRGAEMNKRWPGWWVAVDSKKDAREIVGMLADGGASHIKTFGKFDFPSLQALVDYAEKRGLPVANDPGPTFFHEIPMDIGMTAGIRCIEHGKSPWYVVLKDKWKSEHDKLKEADPETKQAFISRVTAAGAESISMTKLHQLAETMKENGTCLCPTLHVCKYYTERPEVFSEDDPDSVRKMFEPLYRMACLITKEMIRCGVRMLVGQDGYISRFTLNEMDLLKENGLSESEIIRGATLYPAEWLGVADQVGSVSVGKTANILILNKNPLEDISNIRTVFCVLIRGNVVEPSRLQ